MNHSWTVCSLICLRQTTRSEHTKKQKSNTSWGLCSVYRCAEVCWGVCVFPLQMVVSADLPLYHSSIMELSDGGKLYNRDLGLLLCHEDWHISFTWLLPLQTHLPSHGPCPCVFIWIKLNSLRIQLQFYFQTITNVFVLTRSMRIQSRYPHRLQANSFSCWRGRSISCFVKYRNSQLRCQSVSSWRHCNDISKRRGPIVIMVNLQWSDWLWSDENCF